ncbi:gamma-glutamylcyclotransferase [Desulfuromonas versatilis]|uniref:Gamma-glutamylcyclotransferase n=1 Tax=Desulfuromonas versatilis TaxID=2802975 RepID=A0ABN6E1F4_9BACT|nr:gamma-glutamylcyclotransferase family protein [Desulfuromonas versatilis]BCR06141.1 gamma-glutamylcyclotransferase [Desulfuromonas versatilis]
MHYLAYGSNLHPLRLQRRIGDCRLLGTVELARWDLRFHKRGQDGSGKCNLLFTGAPGDKACCALYRIAPEMKKTLDFFEGLGKGYETGTFHLEFKGQPIEAFTYLAMDGYVNASLRPFDWYLELVLLGMEYCAFQSDYTERFAGIETIADHDLVRVKEHRKLLQQIKEFNKNSSPNLLPDGL